MYCNWQLAVIRQSTATVPPVDQSALFFDWPLFWAFLYLSAIEVFGGESDI